MIPLLIESIGSATSSIKCSLYEFNHAQLKTAFIDADSGGTPVSIVTDDDNSDPAGYYYTHVEDLKTGGVDVRYVNSSGIMHTKFCIFDNTDVFTGSMNFTEKGAGEQYNYGAMIKGNSDIVTSFKCNFDESWDYCGNGTNGSCAPSQRTTNCNDTSISVSGVSMETCFSPQGDCMSKVRGSATHTSGFLGTCANPDPGEECASGEICFDYKYTRDGVTTDRHSCDSCDVTGSIIDGASTRLAVSVFFFTDACMAKTMLDATAPINHCLWDALGALNSYSQDNYLCDNNVDCFIEDMDGKNHSKVIVADNSVLIGSMNFSNNANVNNDESTLIIHDATISTQVYNDIGADITELDTRIDACQQQSTENCTDGYDNTGSPPGIDYCDYSCNCTNPSADCLSCLDDPGTGGGEEPPVGGGEVDCDVTPTDPECTGTGTGAPAGYSCETTCVNTRDGSCYCQSTNSANACYDASCDPSSTALTCSDIGDGEYKCSSVDPVSSGDLRAASVTFTKVKGQMQEVHANTKWYAFDDAGLVYESDWCESPHPYTNSCGYGVSGCTNDAMYFCQSYRGDASKIAVWFASIDTEACNGNSQCTGCTGQGYTCVYDPVKLKDSSNNLVATYGGPYTADSYYYGWSSWVTGTTANVYLDTDSSVTDWGFAVSAVVYEPPSSGGGTPETPPQKCKKDTDCPSGETCVGSGNNKYCQ
jgi:HKD family nuclease